MQVILAKTAGFCYGVERAVHMAEVAAREGGCVMLGSIIHNDRVITALEALGARQADSPQQVRPGETVNIGDTYGLIRFGSRLDTYLPAGSEILIELGQRTLAGETVMARLP